jgi:site-specific DNA recombinase
LPREFAAEYHRELNRLNSARDGEHDRKRDELDRVERQLRAIIDAIKDGLRTPGMKDELFTLEERKATLVAEIERARCPLWGSAQESQTYTGRRLSSCTKN